VLRDFLERAGPTVRAAEAGARGLQLYRDRPADLVVCDLYMPGKEGLETIRELRHLDPVAKVIAMSGGSPVVATDFLPLALQLGAARALPKPIGRETLLAAVREVLGDGGVTDAPA